MVDKPVKTRERILLTSLDLFNTEGEPNVTTVDIANELDISPGNLYYHFHGKEVILKELYARFDHRMREVLTAPIERPLNTEDSWYYLYVVFEDIYAFRFLYRNLSDIVERDKDVGRKFGRLMQVKKSTAEAVCLRLRELEILTATDDEIQAMVETIVLTLTYWLPYSDLSHPGQEPAALFHRGVFQIMSIVAPYLGDHQRTFYDECRDIFLDAEAGHTT